MIGCPYCSKTAELVNGSAIYPGCESKVAWKSFWACLPCGAWVGCHDNNTIHGPNTPLGTLANAELRAARRMAHAAFDTIWKTRRMNRTNAYRWLSKRLWIKLDRCHIAMFDLKTCRRVVELCRREYPNLKGDAK